MKKIPLIILVFLAISCSSEGDELIEEIAKTEIENEEEESVNNAPTITSLQYQIDEHSPSGSSIGTITASDVENEALSYTIDSELDILINANTGELTLGENLKLDFESMPSISFSVSVSDGTTTTAADITLSIQDINEFNALNESQLKLVAHFKHLSLFEDTTSPTQEIMRKWNTPMTLFLDGSISDEFQTNVETVIAEYNALTATGDFNITLVETESESNTKLFFGTKAEVASVFPVMYDDIENLNVDGYSSASFIGNFYTTGKIWISNPAEVLFKHELGHTMGLGHSDLCEATNPSVMCSNIALDSSLLEIEQKVIQYFYHSDMPSGLNAEEVDAALANLILLNQ